MDILKYIGIGIAIFYGLCLLAIIPLSIIYPDKEGEENGEHGDMGI